jgi:hypothetical protein
MLALFRESRLNTHGGAFATIVKAEMPDLREV